MIYEFLEDYKKAVSFQENSLVISREVNDRSGEMKTLRRLGNIYHGQSSYKKGIEYQEKSLLIAYEIEDRDGEASALNNLGRGYEALKDYDKAIQYLEKSLSLFIELKNRYGELAPLGNLGNLYSSLGNHVKAIELYKKSLKISQEIKDKSSEGKALNKIGNAYKSLKDYPKAIEYYEQSLAIAREIKHRGGEGESLRNLGNAYYSLGNYPKAIDYHEKHLAITRELKDRSAESRSLLNLSLAYLGLNNRSKAVELSQQALAIARELKNSDLEKSALQVLDEAQKPLSSTPASSLQKAEAFRLLEQGMQQAQNKQFQAAKQSLETALTLYQQIQDPRGEGYLSAFLGVTYGSLGDNKKALELSQKALIIAKDLKDSQLEKLAQQVIDTVQEFAQNAEADRLFQQGLQQYKAGQVEAALRSWEQALVIYQKYRNRQGELRTLGNLGSAYSGLSNYGKAIELYKQRLAIAQELKDPMLEGTTLGGLVAAYTMTGDYGKAIGYGEQYLAISQKIKYDKGEIRSLAFLGNAYLESGDYGKAITFYEQYLAIVRKMKDLKEESDALRLLSAAYRNSGNYGKAIELQEQGLEIARTIKDREGESDSLTSLGRVYHQSNKYLEAIKLSEQGLAIAREIKDRKREGNALDILGFASASLGNYSQAITYQEQTLAIQRELKVRVGESTILNSLGSIYNSLSNYAKAIEYREQSLAIAREIKDRQGEGNALGNLGGSYYYLGNYAKAIEYYKQQLVISREIQYWKGERDALGNLGNIYLSLGSHPQSIEYHKQELAISREVQDRQGEGQALNKLGNVYGSLGDSAKVNEYYRQSLAIAREIQDRKGEGIALNNLGTSSQKLKNYPQAMSYFEQFLAISREFKDRRAEGVALGNLGTAYAGLENYDKAIEYMEQYLAIARETKTREHEGNALSNLGEILQEQQQSELAIVFYKQSVNVRESIRGDLRPLSRDLQISYTQTVAGTYRKLADLLLSQGRIGEAQQVIELLKVQEINDTTQRTRSPSAKTQMALTQAEQVIIQKYNSLIEFGQKLDECKRSNCPQLEDYNKTRKTLTTAYNQFVEELKDQLAKERDLVIAKSTEEFIGGSSKIVNAQPNTVLIYPLVLKDKTRILWASKGGVLGQAECDKGEAELSKLIKEFRDNLQNTFNLKAVQSTGKSLYTCLIPPKLQKELTQSNIQNLVFVPDRVTNYIPMAALHDGQQYLIERFSLSNILSVGLTDTTAKLPDRPSVLGFGLSNALTLKNSTRNFSALPYVPIELDNIVKKTNNPTDSAGVFSGLTLINQEFTESALEQKLLTQKPNILHIATHGEFISTDPKSSFLVLGDGTPYEISKIQFLEDLENVHLVVLSACETALGGSERNGLEVAGIASYFLTSNAKAKAVLASLWKVSDPATALFMGDFYRNLSTRKLTKAAALRQAQIDFLKGTRTIDNFQNLPRRSSEPPLNLRLDMESDLPKNSLAHPYYWAPFILIGNNL